jgi:hypothetical protein
MSLGPSTAVKSSEMKLLEAKQKRSYFNTYFSINVLIQQSKDLMHTSIESLAHTFIMVNFKDKKICYFSSMPEPEVW